LYDAELGIFLSRDFLRFLNKYRAWSNNPVGQVDKDGKEDSDLNEYLRYQELAIRDIRENTPYLSERDREQAIRQFERRAQEAVDYEKKKFEERQRRMAEEEKAARLAAQERRERERARQAAQMSFTDKLYWSVGMALAMNPNTNSLLGPARLFLRVCDPERGDYLAFGASHTNTLGYYVEGFFEKGVQAVVICKTCELCFYLYGGLGLGLTAAGESLSGSYGISPSMGWGVYKPKDYEGRFDVVGGGLEMAAMLPPPINLPLYTSAGGQRSTSPSGVEGYGAQLNVGVGIKGKPAPYTFGQRQYYLLLFCIPVL